MSSPNLGPWQEIILAAGAGDDEALKWVNRACRGGDRINADLDKALRGGIDLAEQQKIAVENNTLFGAQDSHNITKLIQRYLEKLTTALNMGEKQAQKQFDQKLAESSSSAEKSA